MCLNPQKKVKQLEAPRAICLDAKVLVVPKTEELVEFFVAETAMEGRSTTESAESIWACSTVFGTFTPDVQLKYWNT